MNEVVEKTNINNLIYEVRGVQVMLDSEISATKCHGNYYANMVTHYDIDKPISMFKTNKLRKVLI